MRASVTRFYHTFAIGLPYVTISWERGSLYSYEFNWPIGLWALNLQWRFSQKRVVRVASPREEPQ